MLDPVCPSLGKNYMTSSFKSTLILLLIVAVSLCATFSLLIPGVAGEFMILLTPIRSINISKTCLANSTVIIPNGHLNFTVAMQTETESRVTDLKPDSKQRTLLDLKKVCILGTHYRCPETRMIHDSCQRFYFRWSGLITAPFASLRMMLRR